MYQLTKMDIAAIRKADLLSVSLNGTETRVTAIKEHRPTESDPFARDAEYRIEVSVESYSPSQSQKCFALLHLYRDMDCHPSAILSLLRVGDSIRFQFYPDAHTTENLKNAGIHGDVLRLIIERGKARLCFEIASSHCPDNSARMCREQSYQYSLAS
jgi:hypothetical protein